MILPDINVLIYAYRDGAPRHPEYRAWLQTVLMGDQAYAVCDLVLSGFIRLVTHPAIFESPVPVEAALDFVETLRTQPQAVILSPGASHWGIFQKLCLSTAARGNHISDAYLAALAIESGSELITEDRDYSRYAGLRWRPPF